MSLLAPNCCRCVYYTVSISTVSIGNLVRPPPVGPAVPAVPAEQTDPERFYASLAEDAVHQVAGYGETAGTVVDVGGGRRYFTAAFRARGADCYLFEPDHAELQQPRRRAERRAGRRYWLPVRDGGADICFSSNVLEHVADPMGLIDEMIRVTRPGGLIYLSFTNWYSPWGGHEMSPWHYLGPRFAERRYPTRPAPAQAPIGNDLFPLHIGPTLRWCGPGRTLRSSTPCRATTRAGAGPWSGSPAAGGADLEPLAGPAAKGVTTRADDGLVRAPGTAPARGPSRPPLRIEWPQADRPGDVGRAHADRWCAGPPGLAGFAMLVRTDTGRMIFDTKLGVDMNPRLPRAAMAAVESAEWFGTLQNQYIGYAIPMAPFYLAGQLAHVPVWLIERLWLALLVTVGFAGLVKLARALRIGTDGSRLLAGAVFALWPTFTIVIGSTSAAALPGLVAPWAVLPLVRRGSAGGMAAGRRRPISGLAVAAMGGVNAVSTIDVLVLPALFILTQTSGRQRISLLVKWVAAVVAGTAWWLIPLLLQGRYSFNFLPYIEQAPTTYRTMSAAAFLRGRATGPPTSTSALRGCRRLGHASASPAAILASAAAAAAGLYGLARRDMPERRWLLAGTGLSPPRWPWPGTAGRSAARCTRPADALFNGPLAPLRSLYKIEPVVAVALALGCAHAVSRWIRGDVPLRAGRVPMSAAAAPLAALVLIGLAVPQLSGQVLQPGSFGQVPAYWHQAAAFLAAHSPRQTALVVPADAHGLYLWGDPIDDPLEPLAGSPWAERALVPYGGAGSQVFLDTAEQAVESGQAVPGLPAYLARAGIRYVVVRNDLDPAQLGYCLTAGRQRDACPVRLRARRVVRAADPVIPGYPQAQPPAPGLPPVTRPWRSSRRQTRPGGPAARWSRSP